MNKPTPPKFILRFLAWFCPPSLYESIEGDLLERFEEDLKLVGEKKAKRRTMLNVLKFFRLEIVLRNRFSINVNSVSMLQNYTKITLRNLNKRKAYAFINVFGLAVGVAACLVIGKHVEFETSYESFHTKAKNIYRVVSSFYTDGAKESYSGYDLGPTLQQDLPEVKSIARLHGNSSVVSFLDKQGKTVRFYENRINAVDSSFLKMFTFRFVYGNEDALINRRFASEYSFHV